MAAIWDLETRARIRVLEGHVKAVTNLEYVYAQSSPPLSPSLFYLFIW